MTLLIASRNVNIIPSSDGLLYSKFPNGNAIGVTPWDWEGLSTGLEGLRLKTGKGTIEWNAGGFARITSTAQGVTGIEYRVPTDQAAICVQYDVRRHTLACSKQLKVPSKGLIVSPYTRTSNFTFGPTGGGYSNTRIGIYYSDNSTGGDNDIGYYVTGTAGGGSAFNRAAPTFSVTQPADVHQDITGTVWETYKVWWKPNSDNTGNGEFAVWRNGTLIFHAINVWNCATTTGDGTHAGVAEADLPLYQNRGYVGLFEYAQAAGVIEDYRNLKIGYTRPGELP